MNNRFLAPLATLLALASSWAWADDDSLSDAMAAKKAGDFKKTLSIVKALADKGDVPAMVTLGDLYRDGVGVDVDMDKANDLYSKAIAKDPENAGPAYLSSGLLYENGWGVEKDTKKAREYYKKALKANAPGAKAALGRLYVLGVFDDEVEDEEQEGLALIKKGAASGEAQAMVELANYYQYIDETNKHPEKLLKLYQDAAELGNAEAWGHLGQLYSDEKNKATYDPEKAMDAFLKGANLGDPWAQLKLGQTYADGALNQKKDLEKAKAWFAKAEKKNLKMRAITSKKIVDGYLILCYGPYIPEETDEKKDEKSDDDCQKMEMQ